MTCHFKGEPTTFWHCSSQCHRPRHCCTSFLIPFEVFFLHHWTYSVRLGLPLIHSLIIAILRSKFPKVRQCLKWLVFVGAYKFTLCANSGKSWGIPPLRVLETSLVLVSARFIDASMYRDTCHAIRIAIQFAKIPTHDQSPGAVQGADSIHSSQRSYGLIARQTVFNFLQCYMLCVYCRIDQRKETMVQHLSQTEGG